MEQKLTATIFSILLLSVAAVYAEVAPQDGTFGAAFLRLPGSGTSLAMQTADSDWLNPLTMTGVNPARIIRLKEKTVQFSYLNMFDLIDVSNISFGWRMNKKNALGVNIFYLATPLPLTDERGFGLDTFNYSDISGEFIYAYRLRPTAALGLSGKYCQENIYQETTSGLAFSGGIYIQLEPEYGYLSFAVRNAGEIFGNSRRQLPTELYLNWNKIVSYLSLSLAVEEKINQISARAPDGIIGLVIRPVEIIDGYFSYRYSPQEPDPAFSWASGINIKIHQLNINYGFSPHQLGPRQIITLSWSW